MESNERQAPNTLERSRKLAAIVGPTLTLMVLSELKVWNPTLYEDQIVPLVYVSGVLMFLAGLSIVYKHNVWRMSWQVLMTLLGWAAMLLGTGRMFFPQQYTANFENGTTALIVELVLIAIGLILTVKAYFPVRKPNP